MSKQSASDKRTSLYTSLPSNPIDGQEIRFLADAANGIVWHLRFRAVSPNTQKWEVIGGPPLIASVAASANLAVSNTWSDLSGSPSFVMPLAGLYQVGHGAVCANQSGTPTETQCVVACTNSGTVSEPQGVNATGNSYGKTLMAEGTITVAAAGNVVKQQYSQNSTNPVGYSKRWMRLTPVRVG
jgi:hypothetical protein